MTNIDIVDYIKLKKYISECFICQSNMAADTMTLNLLSFTVDRITALSFS